MVPRLRFTGVFLGMWCTGVLCDLAIVIPGFQALYYSPYVSWFHILPFWFAASAMVRFVVAPPVLSWPGWPFVSS